VLCLAGDDADGADADGEDAVSFIADAVAGFGIFDSDTTFIDGTDAVTDGILDDTLDIAAFDTITTEAITPDDERF
jgi:hypothetical protein